MDEETISCAACGTLFSVLADEDPLPDLCPDCTGEFTAPRDEPASRAYSDAESLWAEIDRSPTHRTTIAMCYKIIEQFPNSPYATKAKSEIERLVAIYGPNQLGANAVIAVDLDYSELSGKGMNMLFLVASGTAVKVRKAERKAE